MFEKLPDEIGHALRNRRAGLENVAFNLIDLRAGTSTIEVSSLAFNDYQPIPVCYTADGDGTSPPLQWTGIPTGASSVVVIVEDADAPTPRPLVHAIAVELPPQDGGLRTGALNEDPSVETDGKVGQNSFLQTQWLPPDPPPGHGTHRYVFQVFALAAGTAFTGNPGRDAVLQAIEEYGMASGFLVGTYERSDGTVQISAGVATV